MGEEEEGVGQAPQKVKEPKRGNKSLVLYKAEGEDEGLGGSAAQAQGLQGQGPTGTGEQIKRRRIIIQYVFL